MDGLSRIREGRPARVLALVVSCLLVAACQAGGDPLLPEGDKTRPAQLSPLDNQGIQLARSSKVTRELLDGRISLPWSILKIRGATLLLRVEYGGCAEFDQFKTHEAPTRVTIAARAVAPVPSADICRPDLQRADYEVELNAPLGGRALVHAPVTPHWGDPGATP